MKNHLLAGVWNRWSGSLMVSYLKRSSLSSNSNGCSSKHEMMFTAWFRTDDDIVDVCDGGDDISRSVTLLFRKRVLEVRVEFLMALKSWPVMPRSYASK